MQRCRIFTNRLRLAGQLRLVNARICCFEDAQIGGNLLAFRQRHDIARHQLCCIELDRLATAEHVDFLPIVLRQTPEHAIRRKALHIENDRRHCDDYKNDNRIQRLAVP